jgi:hypothetical protein
MSKIKVTEAEVAEVLQKISFLLLDTGIEAEDLIKDLCETYATTDVDNKMIEALVKMATGNVEVTKLALSGLTETTLFKDASRLISLKNQLQKMIDDI